MWGVSELVSWCFKPSQSQRAISGLKETFIKRYIVARTNKAQIRPEEQSEKRTRQTEEEVGGQHQGMDRPGVRQVPEGSGEQ